MIDLFRRGKRAEPQLIIAPPRGDAHCSVRKCSGTDAQRCAYRDRRDAVCQVGVCASHGVSIAGHMYCRRHASTLEATAAPAGHPRGVPELDDRAPSLVSWIARDLDVSIRGILTRSARRGESVLSDGYVHIVRDHDRRERWGQSWRIVDHTGLVLKVTIYVDDDDDANVHVRVGNILVAQGVPPWIADRREGLPINAALDIARRQRFYEELEAAIAAAVTPDALMRND